MDLGKPLLCLFFIIITYRKFAANSSKRRNTKYCSGKTSYVWVCGVLLQVSGMAETNVLKNSLRKTKMLSHVWGYSA